MSNVYLNARCRKILDILVKSNEYIPLQYLAGETGVSKRSIYYDLCKINEFLADTGLPDIEVTRGKGILIDDDMKRRIELAMNDSDQQINYVFSPSERTKIIICNIIYSRSPVFIEQLTEFCEVSRNTIFNDLKAVTSQLKEFNLTLNYDPKKGYQILGDVVRIRALFFLYFSELLPIFQSHTLKFIDEDEIREPLKKLERIQSELNVAYVDGNLQSLATLIPLMKNEPHPEFPGLKRDEIARTKEFKLIREYFPNLDISEQYYLTLHLLGSRVAAQTEDMFDINSDREAYEITKSLISEFEKVACITFDNADELEHALFLHIKASLYRFKYGIQIGDPVTEDVIREYPNLFEITKIASHYLEQIVGLPIPDSEVAFLALHFGAFLKVSDQKTEDLRVLICCVNGISTGNMLRHEVETLLPEAKIVGVVPLQEVGKVRDDYDLIISTVKINSLVPSILVHPVLTDYDRSLILSNNIVKRYHKSFDTEGMLNILKKYVPKDKQDQMVREVLSFLNGESRMDEMNLTKTRRHLLDFLRRDRISVTDENYSWPHAIQFAGQKLLQEGSITERYIETIISQLRFYGPFMFIMPGVVLAHAKPEDGVNHVDISMTIFNQPIRFSEFYEAKVIITLATEDQEKHLGILSDIMELFSIESRVEELAEMKEPKQILSAIEGYLKQSGEAEAEIVKTLGPDGELPSHNS